MGKRLDLRNKKVGQLTVIEPAEKRGLNGGILWLCHCSCGNKEVYKDASDLKHERVKCCEKCSAPTGFGDKRYTPRGKVTTFKIGNKINHLTIEDINLKDNTYKTIEYLCSCDCGNPEKKLVKHTHLKSGTVKSCGCLHKNNYIIGAESSIKILDITGQRFEKLEAIKCLEPKMKSTANWLFRCDCGNTHILQANDFLRGRASSCGCIVSKGEYLIEKELKKYKTNYKTQVWFPTLIGVNGGYLRFDFGLYNNDKLLCLIEYDGYYHFNSNNLKYKEQDVHITTVEHDKRKEEYCKSHNIPIHRLTKHSTIKEDIKEILNLYHIL